MVFINSIFIQVGLARAARTDAGVHAVGNIVSLKMIMSVPGVDDLCARINTLLPPDIRLWGFVSPHSRLSTTFSSEPLATRTKIFQCPIVSIVLKAMTLVLIFLIVGFVTLANIPIFSRRIC